MSYYKTLLKIPFHNKSSNDYFYTSLKHSTLTLTIIRGKKLLNFNIQKMDQINVNKNLISYSRKVKNFGLTMDEFLSWDDHVSSVCQRT
jgi:hypothetical protein